MPLPSLLAQPGKAASHQRATAQPAPAPPSYSALAAPLEPVAEAPEEPREEEDDAAYESEASSVWSQEPGGPDHAVDEPALPPPPLDCRPAKKQPTQSMATTRSQGGARIVGAQAGSWLVRRRGYDGGAGATKSGL